MTNRFHVFVLCMFSLWFFSCLSAQQNRVTPFTPNREMQSLNADWTYYENITDDPAGLVESTGTTVSLPHTWNQWDAVDDAAGYRRSASWYVKELTLTLPSEQRQILYFEGANTKAKVFVNGKEVGGHVGGYLGFEVDITEALRADEANTIAVRVTNEIDRDLIPSQKSDFFIYGGLTRDVWLKTVPIQHVKNIAISTPSVTKASAETTVKIVASAEATGSVQAQILDPQGRIVATASDRLDQGMANLSFPPLTRPQLWSVDNPNLYEMRVVLESSGDVVSEKFGYRFFRFAPNGPFYLNGERLLLRGTHRHEEHAGLGAAMSNELHRRDIELMKGMGVNFLRLGHYPQDPAIYKACDELGIILWDELPWCRGGKGGAAWEANTERLFREQITQNYNHPSIFFWSLGNELYWLPDFEGGDDTEQLNAYLRKLNDIAHDLDPGRLTTMRKYYAGADITDAFSPSIWSGWYAGVYKNYQQTLDKNRPKYPSFLHMEYGGSSHVGRHTENPITGDGFVNPDEWTEAISQVEVKSVASSGDWSESYIVDLFDWHLSVSELSDWFPGNAQWAFKDFGTPLRPENAIPYLNQKGLVDRSGKPKDAYYVFKSYWTTDPFAYIESHTWTERSGPEGKAREVCVYSNAEAADLTLNGVNLGKRERILGSFPANNLRWELNFKEGANELVSNAYRDGKIVATDRLTVNYTFEQAGTPAEIVLTEQRLDNGNTLFVAIMRDQEGRRCLDYEGRVYFDLNGAGELLVDWGTPTRSQVIEMANGRAAIEAKLMPGRTVVECRNQDFKGSYLTVER